MIQMIDQPIFELLVSISGAVLTFGGMLVYVCVKELKGVPAK